MADQMVVQTADLTAAELAALRDVLKVGQMVLLTVDNLVRSSVYKKDNLMELTKAYETVHLTVCQKVDQMVVLKAVHLADP